MKRPIQTTIALLALCAAAAAWQGALPTLSLNQPDFEKGVRDTTRNFGNSIEPPWIPRKTAAAAKAMTESQRATAVRELGAMAKALVMSPAFQKAHADYIRSSYKAVDHGIQAKTQSQMLAEATAQGNTSDMMRQAAVQMATALRGAPPESLIPMFQSDIKTWTRQALSNGPRKDKAQQLLARAKEIEPWATSKPEEFRKAYSLLKSAEMGGPSTEAEFASTGNSVQSQEEQRQWNQFNLKDLLKRRLTAIIAEAATVDFSAQTTGKDKRFANPAYERKSNLWKLMYRAGQAPTMAASDFAKSWLKEL